LRNHAVRGKIHSIDLDPTLNPLLTLEEGENLNVKVVEGLIYINDAAVIDPDNLAGNGVIHGINKILFPKTFNSTSLLPVCPTATPTSSPRNETSAPTESSAITPIAIMPLALTVFALILV